MSELNEEHLAVSIRVAQTKKRITNAKIAKKIGCHKNHVLNMRKGKVNNIFLLDKFATACDTTLVKMLGLS